MKYKAKFTISANRIKVSENEIFDDQNQSGKLVFIPFTDQRFFEPVKTRKFVIEVNEDDIHRFEYYNINESWTVNEITESSWINQYFKSGSYNAHLFSTDELYTIDVEQFIAEYKYGNKLQGVKWIKDQFGKGLKESKELADFIFAL